MTNLAADTRPPASTGSATSPKVVLRSTEFRKQREAGWRELEIVVGKAEKRGIRALSAEELQSLPVLYRSAQSSLSVARSIALDRNMLTYLENLALRSFLVVYGPRSTLRQGLSHFFHFGFPSAVRGAGWHILLAAAALLAGCIAGFMLTAGDGEWFAALVPASVAEGRGPASSRAELEAIIYAPWPGMIEGFALFANFLFQHNTMVGITTFCLGIMGGVPTLMLLTYQGVILGAFAAIHYDRSLTIDFLGWLSIHGVTELAAIVLCGAAGLVIADKMLFPGRYSRMESLRMHGHQASRIVIGAVLLFFVAGILEGGFRQLVQSTELRFAIGGATGAIWLAYFLLSAPEAKS